jgi:proline iminopeptidase
VRKTKTTLISVFLACALVLGAAGAACAFYQPGVLRGAASGGSGSRDASLVPAPSQQGVAEGYWKVEENILLYHFEHGAGRPVLVIHGGPGIPPGRPWKGLERLSGTYRFFYYHQRGCGKSTHPFDRFDSPNFYVNMQTLVGTLGMTSQLADIERIRQILGEERLILIGHSYGGFMATLYALEFPERVEKMVLLSPAGTLTMPPLYGGLDQLKEYLDERGRREYDSFLARYLDYGSLFQKSEGELAKLNAEYGRFYIDALGSKGVTAPRGSDETQNGGGWSVHALYLSMGRSYDHRDRLRGITAPVLVVHGAKDIYPEAGSRQYADLIPGSRFVVIDEASHFAFDETPERFAGLVSEHLRE